MTASCWPARSSRRCAMSWPTTWAGMRAGSAGSASERLADHAVPQQGAPDLPVPLEAEAGAGEGEDRQGQAGGGAAGGGEVAAPLAAGGVPPPELQLDLGD